MDSGPDAAEGGLEGGIRGELVLKLYLKCRDCWNHDWAKGMRLELS